MSDLADELEATLHEFAVEVYEENFKLKARIKALEGVVEYVKKRQEILNTGKVILQMFPASYGRSDHSPPIEGESGEVLVKKVQAVERKMKKALAKLEEV